MITASVTAASERMRKLINRLEHIEWIGLALAGVFAVAAAFAVHADSTGQKWPTVITSLIAAGLVVTLLGSGFGWALVGSATALARRIDIAATMADQGIAEARVIRAQQEAACHVLWKLADDQQSMIAELGRMRMAERDRSVELERLLSLWAVAEQRHRREVRQALEVAATEGYLKGQADAGKTPDPETLRQIYWRVYSDVMDDLAGGPHDPGDA